MYRMPSLLLCILFSYTIGVFSQDPGTYFTSPLASGFPGYSNVLPIGSQIQVQWTTDLPSYDIFLWQQNQTMAQTYVGDPPGCIQ